MICLLFIRQGLLNLVVRLLKMKKMFIVIQQNQIQLLLSQMEQLF